MGNELKISYALPFAHSSLQFELFSILSAFIRGSKLFLRQLLVLAAVAAHQPARRRNFWNAWGFSGAMRLTAPACLQTSPT